MILRSVRLKNIRSYKEAVVELPEGITLLAGDIGSGKSTILHAVEFALFGVLRGMLPGETLLRYGSTEGAVSLSFEIDGTAVTIERTLKRTKQGITQEAGSLTLDGVTQALTATELKSRILDLLGYPSDLLTKSKGLVYRYTVYTPQEDMKRILFDDPEARLNTLRRVFDIDKYRRISDNAKTMSKRMREDCRVIEGRIADLEPKQEQLTQFQDNHRAINEQISAAKTRVTLASARVKEITAQLNSHETSIKKLNELRQAFAVRQSEQRTLLEQRIRIANEIESVKQALMRAQAIESPPAQTHAESSTFSDPTQLHQSLSAAQHSLAQIETSIRAANHALGRVQGLAGHCTALSTALSTMHQCPTCQQPITDEHKHLVTSAENEKLTTLNQEIATHQSTISQLETSKTHLTTKIEGLHAVSQQIAKRQATQTHIIELSKRSESMDIQRNDVERRLSENTSIIAELNKGIYPFEDVERHFKETKTLHEQALFHERETTLAFTRLMAQQESISKRMAELKEEIQSKLQLKEKLVRDRGTLHWIDQGFIGLMALMEQHVLGTVYHQFNDAFTTWFNTLIEDTLMTARLDDLFSPVVTQNGYDIAAEHLSGGEKTSLALAYRLALTKVINDLHSGIKTRDLIILDEPTDGFSSEQLDRVRDVMRQLPVRQCILVSHETKIESFVDHIITIRKDGHVSRVDGMSV